ncbi:MAG: GIY-YIG nuclease family protein, partial [Gammaproteobacteria bacterium]|nr:GIY-YIG nuclease family protein [Gammaproteobacteria bacterium]
MNRQRINEQAREYRNNAVKSGYVYIMSHDDYPGVLKVGESYDVLRRMSVMSSATVGNFHIEWVAM